MKSFIGKLFFAAALILSTQALTLRADESGNAPFTPGEKLVYKGSYNWLGTVTDVVTGSLTMDEATLDGKTVYKTRLKAFTAKFFDVFFKVREDFQTYLSKDGSFRALKNTRNTEEGKYICTSKFIYDWTAGYIRADIHKSTRGDKYLDMPLREKTYDLPSVLYYVRTLDLAGMREGTAVTIPYVLAEKNVSITITAKGKEKKYVKGLGTVDCLKYGCTVLQGEMFEGDEDAVIWFSNDDNKIIVAFSAPLKIGAVGGRLISYEGLSHPFTALLSTKKLKGAK